MVPTRKPFPMTLLADDAASTLPTASRVSRRFRRVSAVPASRRGIVWILVVILAVAAALYSWNASRTGYSDYYATAARSMSTSWRAFFFGAFDPNATITLDKLSGFLLPQALSARVFGFHAWSLALPQVVEGVLTVLVIFFIASRWLGPRGGLVAAAATAFMPVTVSTFSHPMEDGMLTLFTTLAVWAWQRGLIGGLRRYYLLAGLFVGVAFQAKMLQAWLVLPVFALVLLWPRMSSVTRPLASRLRDVGTLLGAAVVASFAWISAIALVPAGSRPFIDGTTDNNIFTMVIGYNGVDRFLNNAYPGALGSGPRSLPSTGSVGLIAGPWAHTPVKFFLPDYATQVGWLYPLAATGLILGFIVLRRGAVSKPAASSLRVGLVFSTALLVVVSAVLGLMSLPHTAYLAALVLPLSILSAIGAVLLWRIIVDGLLHLEPVVPIVLGVQTTWTLVLLSNYPSFAGWAVWPVAVVGYGLCLLSLHTRRHHPGRRTVAIATVLGLVTALIGPTIWSFSTLDSAFAGNANDAYAGPPAAAALSQVAGLETEYGIGLDSNRVVRPTASLEQDAYAYAEAHAGAAEYALATDTWRSSSPLILDGATRLLPVGGFTGRVDSPTTARLSSLVDARNLAFVLVSVGDGSGAGVGEGARGLGAETSTAPSAASTRLTGWAQAHCAEVAVSSFAPAFANASGEAGDAPADSLYDCR
jgi:4-amino-4-deoxy-L-arabinose transferase-like glycosyltransferase